MNVWDLMVQSAFDTDYSQFKRNYDRDQVKVEKFFWHTLLNIYKDHKALNFFAIYRSLVTLLYDRPAMELALFGEFEGLLPKNYSFDGRDKDQAIQILADQEKVECDITEEIKRFLKMSPTLPEKVNERINLTNNYQPHLPNISSLVWQLNSLANGKFVSCPQYITKERNIELPQLNAFRRYSESYMPYFLINILFERLEDWNKTSTDEFSFKKKVRGPSQAVARELVSYPWLNFQTKEQTAYRIYMYYSDLNGGIFKQNSINHAVNRYRNEHE